MTKKVSKKPATETAVVAAPAVVTPTGPKNYLAEKALLAACNISNWTARRLDRDVTNEVNDQHQASNDAGRYNKLLIEKAALAPIHALIARGRGTHYRMTLPWIDGGARILPATLYADYTNTMRAIRKDYEREADKFARNYAKHVEARRKSLGSMFNEGDYPADNAIRDKFSFEVRMYPCPDANDFRVSLAAEHAEDIRRELQDKLQDALDHAMREPARRIIEVVSTMAERLSSYKPAERDPKTKKVISPVEANFNASLVGNVRELVKVLPAFNLTGDKALSKLIASIEVDLCRHDAEDLKQDEIIRASVAEKAEDILARAQKFIA